MTMRTYWDLTERERAGLEREEVERFIDAELMLKGVLKPDPVDTVPVEEVVLERRTFYRVAGRVHTLDVAFTSEADVRAFVGLQPHLIRRDWDCGSVEYAELVDDTTPIQSVDLPTRESALAHKTALKAAETAKSENDKRLRAFNEQQRKVDEALRGLWEDWYACLETARRVKKIADTREKYLRIANGDRSVAEQFLAQAFTSADLLEEIEWNGGPVDMPKPNDAPKPAAGPITDPVRVPNTPF